MINVIIWSKDRAAQLDLTLSSMKKYFNECESQTVNIIYTYSNPEYEKGYEIVKSYHPEFEWIKESSFEGCTRSAFNSGHMYTSFLVDDDIFVNPFSLEDNEFKLFTTDEKILTYSCRMHPNVTHCYTRNGMATIPPKIGLDGTWLWKNGKGDWGYPMSVASFHVFRTNDITHAINNVPFSGPNQLEGVVLCGNTPDRPKMVGYKQSKCICGTNNKVQVVNNNRNDNSHPLDSLNVSFLEGKRLSCNVNDGLQLESPHGNVKYEWE